MKATDKVANEIAELAAHLDSGLQRLLCRVREFDQMGGWEEHGAASCAHWLSWRIGLDLVTAREKVRVARALGVLPHIDAALARGELSYAKVRAMTRVATPQNEQTLLELARHSTGAQLDRICRSTRQAAAAEDGQPLPEERTVRERLLPGGMVKLELVLAPDEAALVLKAIDKSCEALQDQNSVRREAGSVEGLQPATPQRTGTKEPGHPKTLPKDAENVCGAQPEVRDASTEELRIPDSPQANYTGGEGQKSPRASRADAVVALAEGFLGTNGSQGRGSGADRYQLFVHLDQDVFASDGQWVGTLEDGTRLCPDGLRRLACDAGLVPTRTDASGVTLDLGRRTRAIAPAIRRALWLRDRGCRFPGCSHTRFLHGHHVHHWLHGGGTSLENLISLCSRHHRLVHEGGFRVQLESGKPVFFAPSGQMLTALPSPTEVEDAMASLQGWAADRNIEIGPDTNLPWWDGAIPDYGEAVACLLASQ